MRFKKEEEEPTASGSNFCPSTMLLGHGSEGVKAPREGALSVGNWSVNYSTLLCSRSSIRVPCACELFTSNLTQGRKETPSPNPAITFHANQRLPSEKVYHLHACFKKDYCANPKVLNGAAMNEGVSPESLPRGIICP